jgi:FkbM family methyltransferase
MSLLRQAITEARFFRSHPAADRSTFPRYAAWQVRSVLNLPAVVPLEQYELRFYCPPDRRGTAKLVYTFRERCESELPELPRFAGPGDSVIDIGAHFGIYTVALASLVGPAGSVLAIEAAARAFAMLGRNIALNGLQNVEAIQAAAADQEGTVSFFVSDDPARSSLVAEGGSREEVRALRIDALAIPRPVRFIKIDVEGAEPLALRGAAGILHADRPIIQFESTPAAGPAYGCEPDALWRLLTRECGYRIFEGADLAPVDDLPAGIRNLYAVHPDGPQPRPRARAGRDTR